ncbi:MAG: PKD domain-containing protein [bacterium]
MPIGRFSFMLLAILIAAAALAVDIDIYGGHDLASNGITATEWGSGVVEQSSDVVLGEKSLKITTKGFYSGVSLTFATPIDVSAAAIDSSNLFVFSLYLIDSSSSGSNPSVNPYSGSASSVKPMKLLRATIMTDDNKRTEIYVPVVAKKGGAGWSSYGIPLTAFPNFAATSRKIKQLCVFGDIPATFYLGQIRVASDSTSISVDAYGNEGLKEINIANNDVALLWAVGDAGPSIIKYTWDFDETDGFQEEAEGATIEHSFRKPGTFVVTVKASDRFGTKKEATSKITVKVAP